MRGEQSATAFKARSRRVSGVSECEVFALISPQSYPHFPRRKAQDLSRRRKRNSANDEGVAKRIFWMFFSNSFVRLFYPFNTEKATPHPELVEGRKQPRNLRRIAASTKDIALHRACNPSRGNWIPRWAAPLRDLLHRASLQVGMNEIDGEKPTGIIQRLELDSVPMLPFSIALRDIPRDERGKVRHSFVWLRVLFHTRAGRRAESGAAIRSRT